jgi:hypothetical protein
MKVLRTPAARFADLPDFPGANPVIQEDVPEILLKHLIPFVDVT